MPVYATADDFTDPPENITTQIMLASSLVDDATMTAFYTVDAEGVPTNEDIRSRFKAAVIAQVGYWAELGINPAVGPAGVTGEKQASTKTIGSASISYEFRVTQHNVNDRLATLYTLCPEGVAVLGSLARGPVVVRG
ncbi:MAG: hypothetical protein ACTIJR_07980 [Brevibacterium linens]